MAKEKIYKCCICHSIIVIGKPHRLVQQEYGAGNYKQYAPVDKFDLCDKHFQIFMKWIKKNQKD
jgi:hypothetical protein